MFGKFLVLRASLTRNKDSLDGRASVSEFSLPFIWETGD